MKNAALTKGLLRWSIWVKQLMGGIMRRSLFALTLCVLITPIVANAVIPDGAVRVTKNDSFKISSFHCAKTKNKWIPGRMVSRYFYSHTAERANVLAEASRAKGKRKTTLKAEAALLKSQIIARAPICRPGPATRKYLRFNFANAVGLALKPAKALYWLPMPISTPGASDTPSSNLMAVGADGSLSSAVISGNAVIGNFFIAPNNKIYVFFLQAVNLKDTSSESNTCLFAEVDIDTGLPVCIESQLLVELGSGGGHVVNGPVQFDNAGNIYYVGWNASSHVLRRYSNGKKTNLISGSINDFLLLPDGRIIVSGAGYSSNGPSIRRITPSGGLANLYTSTIAPFIQTFPDNNVYIGNPSGIGIYRVALDSIDPKPWAGISSDAYNDLSSMCGSFTTETLGFCGYLGAQAKSVHRTMSGKLYAIAGYGSDGIFMKYYPVIERPVSVVKKATVAESVLNSIVLTGLNASNKNVTTLFNTDDGSEIEVFGGDNEIEVYHLRFSAAENAIFFDGLRFSDGKYLLGKYDFNTMTATASCTGSTKLDDLQTFN